MNTVTKQHKPVDTGFVFSIGPAVDLAELDNAMRKFARQPYPVTHIETAHTTTAQEVER